MTSSTAMESRRGLMALNMWVDMKKERNKGKVS